MVVAIDVGYGFTKAASAAGRRCCLPSAVTGAGRSGVLAGALGTGAVVRHRVRLEGPGTDGTLLAGEAALAAGARRTWDPRAADRAGYAALVLTALALVGAQGAVELAVGLPLGPYLQAPERVALRETLAGIEAGVAVDGGATRHLRLDRVRVLPQAAGAFAAALQTQPGLANAPVGLIDVGYRTCDLLLLRPGSGGLVPDDHGCGSLEAGVGRAFERVRAALGAQTGALVPEGLVEESLAHSGGRLHVRGRAVDLAPLVEGEFRALAGEVAAEVRRLWGDRLEFLASVLVAGGGGAALASHLRGLHPTLALVPDPLFANALGFLRL